MAVAGRRGTARPGAVRRPRHLAFAVLSAAALIAGEFTLCRIYQPVPRPMPDSYRMVAAGPGHGRGMSQFGAFDQAAAGVTADRILLHYYPGATAGRIAPATTVRVRLSVDDGETLDVYSDAGLTVAGRRVPAGQVAHLRPQPDGGAAVTVTIGCSGEVLWRGSTPDPWAYPRDPGSDRPAAEHLRVCDGGTYRGALGVAMQDGAARTVDRLDVEDYLLGVVPAEMQADWADRGGAEALRAQAVAARSYALAEHRYPYAQTCDTTDCQEYPGTVKEDARTTAAVRATAGQVLLRDGHILRTEYSAAPGGGTPGDITTFAVGPTPAELATESTSTAAASGTDTGSDRSIAPDIDAAVRDSAALPEIDAIPEIDATGHQVPTASTPVPDGPDREPADTIAPHTAATPTPPSVPLSTIGGPPAAYPIR